MECLRFFVSGQTWACGLLASEAAAHNLKGERAPVALCREPTEAAAETVGSNPAPAKSPAAPMRFVCKRAHGIPACCHFCRFSPLSPVVDKAAVLSYNGKQKAPV